MARIEFSTLLPPEHRHVVFADAVSQRRRALTFGEPSLVAVPSAAEQLPEDALAFLRFLFHEAGLCLSQYRLGTLRRRIPACLRELRASSFTAARRSLQSHPQLLPPAISSLIIGVTSFFRDAPVFEFLQKRVLPDLLTNRRGLTAWCAGCSDGSEAYSVAITLDQMGALEHSLVLGTDCRADAIRKARAGLYDASSLKCVSTEILGRHFIPHGAQYRLPPNILARTHWRCADVLALNEPGAWDLIFCRNLAMYLSAEASQRLWMRLESSLRPGGVLVLGKAERPTGARYLSPLAPCIYRRNRG